MVIVDRSDTLRRSTINCPPGFPGQQFARPLHVSIILMGVTGAGKTTVGLRLAASLGWPFYDADSYHPPGNIAKMRAHLPLTDEDRQPWLRALERLLARVTAERRDAVLACSALRRAYRESLASAAPVSFVYLRVPLAVATARLMHRRGHFMPADLVPAQYATLEEPSPAEALIVDATGSPEAIVETVQQALGLVGKPR